MRRLLMLALLAAFVGALAGLPRGATGAASGVHSTAAASPGTLGSSRPVDDGGHWRHAHATSATAGVSAWRVHELHAHFAMSSVFVEFASVLSADCRVDDSPRPHAPPHPLNDSLRI